MRKTSLICIIQLAGKANRNEAGWSIQADFFADIPENPFWGNQEAKTSESRRIRRGESLNTLLRLILNIINV